MLVSGKEMGEKDIERFWDRIDIRGKDECWEWQAGKNSSKPGFNYGLFWIHGRSILAHRAALALHTESDLYFDEVLHSCDNPPCCNPHHLREGSHRENMKDRSDRGRVNAESGENRYNAKLTDIKVREIRNLHSLQEKYKKYKPVYLAKMFDVDVVLIRRVISRQAWKHVKD